MPDEPDDLFPDDWEIDFEKEGDTGLPDDWEVVFEEGDTELPDDWEVVFEEGDADLPEEMYYSLDDAAEDGWSVEDDNYRGMFPNLQMALAYIGDVGLPYVIAIDDDGWVHVWIAYDE